MFELTLVNIKGTSGISVNFAISILSKLKDQMKFVIMSNSGCTIRCLAGWIALARGEVLVGLLFKVASDVQCSLQ